jgi:hypothetical protein
MIRLRAENERGTSGTEAKQAMQGPKGYCEAVAPAAVVVPAGGRSRNEKCDCRTEKGLPSSSA